MYILHTVCTSPASACNTMSARTSVLTCLCSYIYVCTCHHQSATLHSVVDAGSLHISVTSYLRTVQSVKRLVMGMKLRIWIPNTDRNLFELVLDTVGGWGLFQSWRHGAQCMQDCSHNAQVRHTVTSAREAVSLLTWCLVIFMWCVML